MEYPKVNKGDALSVPADTWNALMDVALEMRAGGGGVRPRGTKRAKALNAGVVLVQNKSGQAIQRYHVLGIDVPVVPPATSEVEFKRHVVMRGVMPTAAHAGLWCVVQESIPIDGWGQAVVEGISQVRINLATTSHRWVEASSGSQVLLSDGTGTGQITWVAGGVGTAAATGEQWAWVRFPMGGGGDDRGEFQWQEKLMVSANQPGWDDARATAAIEDG